MGCKGDKLTLKNDDFEHNGVVTTTLVNAGLNLKYFKINHKAQVAIEFISVFGFSILLMLVMLGVINLVAQDYNLEKKTELFDSYAQSIQNELLLGASAHSGYKRTVILPDKLGRYDYSVFNSQDTLTFNSSDVIVNIPIPEISGTLKKGRNLLVNDGVLEVIN